LLVLALAIALVASPMHHVPTGSMQATPAQEGSAPIYLALGDSLAVGAGASEPAISGYVPLLHEMIKADHPCEEAEQDECQELVLVNLAEGGATTASLKDAQLPAALELLEERNSDDNPTNDVSVITITIGGNDAFNALAPVCADGLTPIC
jgi:lysophospholipase L1-like esterase